MDGPTSIYGDIGTQGVIEYIRRVSDIKRAPQESKKVVLDTITENLLGV